jgi:C-terminal processing protease CtpA/Prc
VRPYFRRAKAVSQFHAAARQLSPRQRARLVRQAIMLFEGLYVNLPLKCAMYAVDPLRRLRLLEQRLPTLFDDDRAFHREMTDIFASLCDQHANYFLPAPYKDSSAWLPFKVEFCHDHGRPQYVVTRISDGFAQGAFRPGVEILSWNGVPIARAVEIVGALTPGSNVAGRRALALMSLTARVLSVQPAPDEEWVMVGYRTPRGRPGEIRVQWAVTELPPSTAKVPPRGLSVHVAGLQHIRKVLFAPHVVKSAKRMSTAANPLSLLKGTESTMPDVFSAGTVATPDGRFGYLRIFTFDVADSNAFVEEFIRLMKLVPQNGLIIDVRDNPGGRSRAAEELLQLVLPVDPNTGIEPERLNFINTPLTLELCKLQRSNPDLGPNGADPWIKSIQLAMQTGATYSANFPYSDRAACNARGRLYPGPAIVVTSALSRSAAEVFAAGFQDHGGKILGVDEATGGAGGNARTYSQFAEYFKSATRTPFKPLPLEADFQVPFRRFQRVGRQVGNEIEDFGVRSDVVHVVTRNDVLKGNVDLINHAGRLLVSKELRAQTARHDS